METHLNWTTAIGLIAAACTSGCYLPQVKKSWQTGEVQDLSLIMLSVLFVGVATWIVYGILQSDAVIIVANAVSLVLVSALLVFKLRGLRR